MKKEQRVKKSQEFTQIIQYKHYFNGNGMVLYVMPKKEEKARVGISVKKKVGHAVVRNKVKRQVRMMIDDIYDFEETFDSILIIKEGYLKNDYMMNKKVLMRLYKKAKVSKIDE